MHGLCAVIQDILPVLDVTILAQTRTEMSVEDAVPYVI